MAELQKVTLGLIGQGTIGSGVVKLLRKGYGKNRNVKFRLKRIVDVNPKCKKYPGIKYSKKVDDILTDPNIDIVIELIGGYEPAYSIMRDAIKAGKHVVTANKAVVSKFGPMLFKKARAAGVSVGFEASVCGSIPILRTIMDSLPNPISNIVGILNGSTNYILTKMTEQDYGEALRDAQLKGFAERDPRFDVEGLDAAQKLSILSMLAFNKWVNPDKIYTEGITQLAALDIKIAAKMGYAIKLVAVGDDGVPASLRVHPAMVPLTHPLAHVQNEFNAVYLEGAATGPQTYIGKGAGELPTANAVLSDCVNIALGQAFETPECPYRSAPLEDMNNLESRYYIRFTTQQRIGILAKLSDSFARHKVSISIDNIPQLGSGDHESTILLTHPTLEAQVRAALRHLSRKRINAAPPVLIRIMD